MNISDEGIDYKGRKYKRRDLGKASNISGETFTYLKALFRVEDKYNSWLCQCKCGNLTVVKASHLKDGSIKSCGCYSIEQSHNRTSVDLTNKPFGELTVLEEFLKEGQKKRFWRCLCSCGKETIVNQNNLVSGTTKSCGHLKNNFEDLSGQTFGYWLVLNERMRIKNKTKWKCICKCGTIRWVRGDWLKDGRSQSCGCKNSSKGADRIEKILKENCIIYTKEYCFEDLLSDKNAFLRFDFAVFDANNILQYLIEFDGEFHYNEKLSKNEEEFNYRKLCDKQKNDYCLKNKIPLYRIPYFDSNINSLNDILQNKYLIS